MNCSSGYEVGYPKIFPTTFIPTPNIPKQIFRQLHFPTVKFSYRHIFRRTNFSKILYILLTLIHVTHYTYRVSILISNMLIKKLFLGAYNLFMQVIQSQKHKTYQAQADRSFCIIEFFSVQFLVFPIRLILYLTVRWDLSRYKKSASEFC